MSSQEDVDVKTDDITTERDSFWAAVKIEEDVDPLSPPALSKVRVKQEPYADESSSLINSLSGELDSFLPPVEKITVDSLAFKPEHDEDASWLELLKPEVDPLLLPDIKQEYTGGELACSHPENSSAVTCPEYLTSYCGDGNSFKREPHEQDDSKSLAFSQVVDSNNRSSSGVYGSTACDDEQDSVASSLADKRDATFILDEATQVQKLKQHAGTHYIHDSGMSPCSEAVRDECFISSGKLDVNQETNIEITRFECEKRDYPCDISNGLEARLMVRLKSGSLPFKCNTCGKEFTRQGNLKSHMLLHADDSSRVFICDLSSCGKRFKRNQHLKRHALSHADDSSKVFVCDVFTCGKRFKSKHHLKRHALSHTDDSSRVFVCDVSTCSV